jgi:decaprenylphospho-beta-D-erythro-pentofuranosid-2-ulose 2-reductase
LSAVGAADARQVQSAFTSGRQRLHSKGVRVLTIKPGFVDAPMTMAFRKGALWASPPTVGAASRAITYRNFRTFRIDGFF